MKQKNKIKGKGVPTGSGTPPIAQGEGSIVPPRVDTSTNPFETLSTSEKLPELAEEEVEQQAIAMEEDKWQEETGPLQTGTPRGVSSSSTYAEMTRKKTLEISRSLERVGMKSHKEARELEEENRQKM